jgi:hypothetical protein
LLKAHIANQIEGAESLRTDNLDVESFSLTEISNRIDNLMWFCSISSFAKREALILFIDKFSRFFTEFPSDYLREGLRTADGAASFLYFTRNIDPSRLQGASLFFDVDTPSVEAKSRLGSRHTIEKSALIPGLRVGVGISLLKADCMLDYFAYAPYRELDAVVKGSSFKRPENFEWKAFWERTSKQLHTIQTNLATLSRIDVSSPHLHLIAFFSDTPFAPSNKFKAVNEKDLKRAKAVCVALNSVLSLTQLFLILEGAHARYAHIMSYDYNQMHVFPNDEVVTQLAQVFDAFSGEEFPSLREQLDLNFNNRNLAFQKEKRKKQQTFFSFEEPVTPSQIRLDFDMAICNALSIQMTEKELCEVYQILADEMIINHGLGPE